MENKSVCVVVLDREGYRLLSTNEDIATTLVAVASEDPADWIEMMAYWPRYTTRAVPEFASLLRIELVERKQAFDSLHATDDWVFLDLIEKRFLSGKAFQEITHDACFAMHTDVKGDQLDPLSVHLAPWWELNEQVDPSAIAERRETPPKIPFVDRKFLFGQPLVEDLAKRVLEIAATEHGRAAILSDERNELYPLTIEVHRDWLMTPRDDLEGKFPRQLLHGGVDWIDKLKWGHRLRFEQGGQPIVAAPKDVSGYENAPMGGEEMALFFDLCRELLDAAWLWCKQAFASPAEATQESANDFYAAVPSDSAVAAKSPTDLSREDLVSFLGKAKENWLNNPFEGDAPPAFIIECSRRRVPRGAGVEIEGMDDRQTEQHVIDCDCPICLMMADGMFGVGFTSIDGHHLELDDEFAFSMHETREAWEEQQREYAGFATQCDRDREGRERKIEAGEIDEADEFASAWSGGMTTDPLPGDSSGNLKLAFLLAEIVSEIQLASSQIDRSLAVVKQLNVDFSGFRTCQPDQVPAAATKLSSTLESIAQQNPALVARVADFQSRIQAQIREPVASEDLDDDFPF